MLRTRGLVSQAEKEKSKKMKYATSTSSSMKYPLLKCQELLDELVPLQTIHPLTLQLHVFLFATKKPYSLNLKPKSPNFVVVEKDSSSI